MTDWLLAHSARIFFYTLEVVLACAFLLETFFPNRPFGLSRGERWVQQLVLVTLGSMLTRVCLPIAALSLTGWAQEQHWGLLNRLTLPLWLSLSAGVMVIDLGLYALHRVSHAVPLLWRFHQVHHSDLDVDCGTALRHHPAETLLVQAFQLALIAAFGISPIAIFIVLALGLIDDIFSHANFAFPETVDRALRWVVVTPGMHRIHHSADQFESNRNFSNVFPWWDHLFSTYLHSPESGHARMSLGLGHLRAPTEVALWKLLVLPFRSLRIPRSECRSQPESDQQVESERISGRVN